MTVAAQYMSADENPVSSRIFDRRRGRLIYIGEKSTPQLWDTLWRLDEAAVAKAISPSREGDLLVRATAQYVRPDDGPILEGGCGNGKFVAALHRAGYQATGIDFAEATVKALNEHAPHLDIRPGDLRNVPLPDGSVAGYWSIGVIEHFWDGFLPIAQEMARVVREGGYLFCSFPFMNLLRTAKARLRLYPERSFEHEPAGFYQFALPLSQVTRALRDVGFDYVSARRSSGLKGVLGECGSLSRPLERLYSYNGSSLVIRGMRYCCDRALTAAGTPHSVLVVFRRRSNPRSAAL